MVRNLAEHLAKIRLNAVAFFCLGACPVKNSVGNKTRPLTANAASHGLVKLNGSETKLNTASEVANVKQPNSAICVNRVVFILRSFFC